MGNYGYLYNTTKTEKLYIMNKINIAMGLVNMAMTLCDPSK